MNSRMLVTLFAIVAGGIVARAAEPIRVHSAFVRVLEEADIPAREVGVLSTLEVREGDVVKAGQVLSRLDDDDAKLAVARAELDLAIAERQAKNTVPIRTAEALFKEAEQDQAQAKLSQRIASMKAANDVAVRHAVKSRDASKAEYDRAVQARKAFEKSISLTELDRLKLILERNDLEIEKAKFEQDLAELQQQIEDSSIAQQDQIVARLKLSVEQAQLQSEVDALTRDVKARTLDQAKLQLARRGLRSPLDGEVAEIFRHRGEWLEPGQRVMRIVRLDRLKVEGFVDSREITGSLRGAAVRVRVTPNDEAKPVTVKGKVVFISSEIESVSAQVRVWAEVENPDLVLRPGLSAEMIIDSSNRTAATTAAPAKTDGER
ncbi:MAG: HlyD family efflux transporter periplasmic adaptor subunit [Planctomycetes bacterium]|nr:HlyD family efflux transporter periplasmic adaptor subunit [Planctomycetota bacterium]